MLNEHERRRCQRFVISSRCWISDTQHLLYAPISNISRSGFSIAGITPFQAGQEISIKIEGYPHGHDFLARSRVVWAKGEEDPAQMGMGAEFIEILSGEKLLEHLTSGNTE